MANTLGTLSPVELTMDCIQALKKKFPILTQISTDFSSSAVKYNQQVISRVVTPVAAADYSTTLGYVASAATTTDVPVTLDHYKHVSISVTDAEMSATPRNLIKEQVDMAAYSLGLQICNDLMALLVYTNFASPAPIHVGSGPVTRATILTGRQALVTAGADSNHRFGLLNPKSFSEVAQDSNTFAKLYSGTDIDYDGGSINGLVGFDKIMETAGTFGTNAVGYLGNKESLLLCARVPADPGATVPGLNIPGIIDNVTDQDTGLTFQFRYHYSMALGALQLTITCIYGVATGVTGHGVLLVL